MTPSVIKQHIIKQEGDLGFSERFDEVTSAYKDLCKGHRVDYRAKRHRQTVWIFLIKLRDRLKCNKIERLC